MSWGLAGLSDLSSEIEFGVEMLTFSCWEGKSEGRS